MILPKPKTCRCGCKQKFTPRSSFHTAATPDCALRLVAKKKAKDQAILEKKERAELAARKQEVKPLQYWKDRAKRAVQALARWRDKDLPCISCGSYEADQWDGGHFVSSDQYPAVRFDLANINKQCRHCNKHRHGASAEYEVNLVIKIGRPEVERLKASKGVFRWTREEMQAIEADAKERLKALKANL